MEINLLDQVEPDHEPPAPGDPRKAEADQRTYDALNYRKIQPDARARLLS